MAYDIYPAVDEGHNFPPEVRQSIAASTEVKATVENTMGEVVDDLVADSIASDPTIKQAAIDAVEPVLLSTNVVRAYPEGPVQQTSKTEIPMWWTYKVLNDPYSGYYSDTYDGTWSGSLAVRGMVPILDKDNKIDPSHVPSNVVTRSMLPGLLPPYPTGNDIVDMIRLRLEETVDTELPIFASRLAHAKKNQAPCAVVIEGSSTSWTKPGYVAKLSAKIQNAYLTELISDPQWSNSNDFTTRPEAGVHVYNGAQSGSNSESYLVREEIEKLAVLKPALMIHMVGSNDYRQQMAISTYKSNLQQRLAWCDELFTAPCQHLFIQAYARMDVTDPSISWDAYGNALKEISDSRPDSVYRDLSKSYIPNGVPGSDPQGMIGADKVHQTSVGYEFMADLMTNIILN